MELKEADLDFFGVGTEGEDNLDHNLLKGLTHGLLETWSLLECGDYLLLQLVFEAAMRGP